MRKASSLVLAGLGAVALTGAAAAASRDVHTMDVPLPDGSVAKIEYVGKVAPKVSVMPAPVAAPFVPFALFGRSAFDFQQQMDAMMRQIDAMTRTAPAAGAPGLNVAAYGNAPAGSQSVTVVSTSNGAKTCTRTTEVTSQGPGEGAQGRHQCQRPVRRGRGDARTTGGADDLGGALAQSADASAAG